MHLDKEAQSKENTKLLLLLLLLLLLSLPPMTQRLLAYRTDIILLYGVSGSVFNSCWYGVILFGLGAHQTSGKDHALETPCFLLTLDSGEYIQKGTLLKFQVTRGFPRLALSRTYPRRPRQKGRGGEKIKLVK